MKRFGRNVVVENTSDLVAVGERQIGARAACRVGQRRVQHRSGRISSETRDEHLPEIRIRFQSTGATKRVREMHSRAELDDARIPHIPFHIDLRRQPARDLDDTNDIAWPHGRRVEEVHWHVDDAAVASRRRPLRRRHDALDEDAPPVRAFRKPSRHLNRLGERLSRLELVRCWSQYRAGDASLWTARRNEDHIIAL